MSEDVTLDDALRFLDRHGYRRCDIPACNCNLWHGGYAHERLEEIRAALEDASMPWQGTILLTLRHLLAARDAEVQALREENARLRAALEGCVLKEDNQ